jgi:hypothetical protein
MKERGRERGKGEWRGKTEPIPTLKAPWQGPFVLLIKVGWRESKALGSE